MVARQERRTNSRFGGDLFSSNFVILRGQEEEEHKRRKIPQAEGVEHS